MRLLKSLSIPIVVLLVTIGVSYLAWQAERNVDYNLSYEDQVTETLRKLIKPKCLK